MEHPHPAPCGKAPLSIAGPEATLNGPDSPNLPAVQHRRLYQDPSQGTSAPTSAERTAACFAASGITLAAGAGIAAFFPRANPVSAFFASRKPRFAAAWKNKVSALCLLPAVALAWCQTLGKRGRQPAGHTPDLPGTRDHCSRCSPAAAPLFDMTFQLRLCSAPVKPTRVFLPLSVPHCSTLFKGLYLSSSVSKLLLKMTSTMPPSPFHYLTRPSPTAKVSSPR
jgi:hypothetical protein